MKKYLFKAVLPVSMAVCAITFGACSQDELLTPAKEQSEEGNSKLSENVALGTNDDTCQWTSKP